MPHPCLGVYLSVSFVTQKGSLLPVSNHITQHFSCIQNQNMNSDTAARMLPSLTEPYLGLSRLNICIINPVTSPALLKTGMQRASGLQHNLFIVFFCKLYSHRILFEQKSVSKWNLSIHTNYTILLQNMLLYRLLKYTLKNVFFFCGGREKREMKQEFCVIQLELHLIDIQRRYHQDISLNFLLGINRMYAKSFFTRDETKTSHNLNKELVFSGNQGLPQ